MFELVLLALALWGAAGWLSRRRAQQLLERLEAVDDPLLASLAVDQATAESREHSGSLAAIRGVMRRFH
jgi:hypothetical protein